LASDLIGEKPLDKSAVSGYTVLADTEDEGQPEGVVGVVDIVLVGGVGSRGAISPPIRDPEKTSDAIGKGAIGDEDGVSPAGESIAGKGGVDTQSDVAAEGSSSEGDAMEESATGMILCTRGEGKNWFC
jgi:hypothetical protein